MTKAEAALVLSACTLGAVFAAARLEYLDGAPWKIAVAGFMGFDILGGAVCNATAPTRAWYHRPGQGWRDHLLFVIPHLAYVAVVAGVARGPRFDVPYASSFMAGILIAAAIIIAAPPRLRAAVAFSAFLVLLVGMTIAFGTPVGFEWFAPGLLLKLLVGHLVGPGAAHSQSG